MRRIGDILSRYKEAETVQDDVTYKQVTIGTNYKGVRLRGTKTGIDIGTKNQWIVKSGQFILSRIDARNGAFGIIPENLEGALVTNDFLAYVINEDEVERDFFNVFLQSPQFLEACIKASRGNTNRKRVQEDFFLDYEVNLPLIEEQKVIIKKIQRAKQATAIVEREITHQLALLTKLKQAILQEAIEGGVTADWRTKNLDIDPASELLKHIQAEGIVSGAANERGLFTLPKGWVWVKLGDIAHIERGGSPRPISDYITNEPDGVNWIKIGDTKKGSKYITSTKQRITKRGVSKTRIVVPGDFLLTNSMSFGRPYITKIEGGIHDGWLRIHPPKSLNKDYLYLMLSSSFVYKSFTQSATGAVVQNLNAEKVRELAIPLPPQNEQDAIVSRVEALMTTCDELEAQIEHSRTHAAELLQAVLKEAFAPS